MEKVGVRNVRDRRQDECRRLGNSIVITACFFGRGREVLLAEQNQVWIAPCRVFLSDPESVALIRADFVPEILEE
jgi:hypothetical protein